MAVTAGAFPDVQRRAPVTVTADTPILHVLQPVAEAALADGFGNPVDGVVVADQILTDSGHLDEPGFSCVVDQGGCHSASRRDTRARTWARQRADRAFPDR